jgi:RNA 2',3'-cyclic 3'-phosphodiesterase
LFVAVPIPEAAADAVEDAFDRWRREFPKARWVPRENLHVTLRFLGSTYPRLVPWVRDRLAEVAAGEPRFETRVRDVGGFPSARRARVVWAGIDDADGALARLAEAVQAELAREFPPESRPFSAHVTVARSDPPLSLPTTFAATELESPPFVVDALVLMRSHLRRPAPRYEPVATFPLA